MSESHYEEMNAAEEPTTGSAAESPLKVFLEHQKRAIEETGKAIDALLPEGFKEHGKAAREEFAKGFKVLIDAAAGELEKAGKDLDARLRKAQQRSDAGESGASTRPSSTGHQKVKVQVD